MHDDADGAEFGSVITNQTKVQAVAALSSDGKVLSIHDFALARLAAEAQSPPLGDPIQGFADMEPSLVLNAFGRTVGDDVVLDLDAFESVYGENRFPTGFVRKAQPVTFNDVESVADRITAAKKDITAGKR